MLPEDESKFVSLLTGIAAYYRYALPEMVIDLYWNGLKQYDYPAIEKALWEHTQNPDTGQFMPKIADVTKMLQGSTVDQAALAWSKVDDAVRRIGTYQDVVFDDPVIHRVIADMGGWIKLGTIKDEEWKFTENHFRTRYKGYKARSDVPEYHRSLTGIANAQNAVEGFEAAPPILIGNQEKAKQVLLRGSNRPAIEMKPATMLIQNEVEG